MPSQVLPRKWPFASPTLRACMRDDLALASRSKVAKTSRYPASQASRCCQQCTACSIFAALSLAALFSELRRHGLVVTAFASQLHHQHGVLTASASVCKSCKPPHSLALLLLRPGSSPSTPPHQWFPMPAAVADAYDDLGRYDMIHEGGDKWRRILCPLLVAGDLVLFPRRPTMAATTKPFPRQQPHVHGEPQGPCSVALIPSAHPNDSAGLAKGFMAVAKSSPQQPAMTSEPQIPPHCYPSSFSFLLSFLVPNSSLPR